MVVFRHREAPQIAHHEQRVGIDGVGVEQVVLHASDHASERGNVAAENAVHIHAPQLVGDADRRAQDLHEEPVMARVLPKFLIDERYMRADEADGLGAHAAQLRVLLQEHEQLEQRRRIAGEYLGMGDLQIIVADLEARVDGHRRAALGEYGLAKQLQQHLVEQAHVHHRAVVLLHELLDREREARILVAEELRELDLVVEQQPVLAPAGEHVQPEPYFPQERLARLELAQLLAGQKAVRHQLIERVGAEMALRDPADGLDVAQAAGARLDVRLEVVGGIEIAVMALGLFLDLGLEEILRGPEPVGRERTPHAGEQRLGSREQPRLEQRGRDADVGEALALAIVDRAHAVPDLEADVPEEGEEALDVRLPVGGVALRQQHHDVDVGARVQLAPAVTADRHQREVLGIAARVPAPGGAQRHIHEPRAVAHQVLHRLARREALAQQVRAAVEDLAKHDRGELAARAAPPARPKIGPISGVIEELGSGAQEATAALDCAAAAPRVSTS